jgi:hypothetical protein
MGRLGEFKAMIQQGRLGFLVDEVMNGEHSFEPAFGSPERRPMEFRVTWGTKNIPQWANPAHDRFMAGLLRGWVTIDGLCYRSTCSGSLELRYFKDHTIRYTFGFEVDGDSYRYVGEKVNINLRNLPWSHTTCFGRLVLQETGQLVSTSVTHFRMRSLPRFLASIRLA